MTTTKAALGRWGVPRPGKPLDAPWPDTATLVVCYWAPDERPFAQLLEDGDPFAYIGQDDLQTPAIRDSRGVPIGVEFATDWARRSVELWAQEAGGYRRTGPWRHIREMDVDVCPVERDGATL